MGYKTPIRLALSFNSVVTAAFVDSTEYFSSGLDTSWNTTESVKRLYPRLSGRIVGAVVQTYSVTAAGTAEDWPMAIRLNNTTDYAISTQSVSAATRNWYNMNLNIPITLTDFISIKTTTPAWVTNPADTYTNFILYIELE